MNSQTSLVARDCRIQEWMQMIQECKNRPVEMSVDEWCKNHSLTKSNYYYRVRQVNNPVPVSLLSGDRKPQIRFLGNHHSGDGNPYHKSFRM